MPNRKLTIVRMRLDLYEWIQQQIETRGFWNVSHAVEVALLKLRDSEK